MLNCCRRKKRRPAGLQHGALSSLPRFFGFLFDLEDRQDDCADHHHGRCPKGCVDTGERIGCVGCDRIDRNEDCCTDRAGDLTQRCKHGVGVRNDLAGEVAHAPGVDRHHHEVDTEDTDGVEGDEHPGFCLCAEEQVAAGTDRQKDQPEDAQRTCADLVVETADDWVERGCEERSWQHDECGPEYAVAVDILQIDWREHTTEKERGVDDHPDDETDREALALECVKTQERCFKLALAFDEEISDQCASEQRYIDVRRGPAVAADGAEAVKQTAEAQRREQDGCFVEIDVMGFAGVWHDDGAEDDIDNDQRNQPEEDDIPAVGIDDKACDRRTDGWCDRKDEPDHAHRFTALVWWIHHEDGPGKEWH